jgi:uncharacterized protein
MAKFEITAWHPENHIEKQMIYDSSLSTLTWEDGTHILGEVSSKPDVITPAKINHGKKDLKTIKIQLGLSCNFECDYCSQRFVPNSPETNQKDVTPFVENMATWCPNGDDGLGKGIHFEFWGGEPFVYWKTMKPLAEAIRKKYPNSTFSVITNGSILDNEKIEWLEELDFYVGISHDGPGQPVRGPDPFDDLETKKSIAKLYKRFAPADKFSFNAMIHTSNISRDAIQQYFTKWVIENVGDNYVQYLRIGEGGFVDAYDEGGLENSFKDQEQEIVYRNTAYKEIREYNATKFESITQKIQVFINSIKSGNRLEALPQKCGMDQSDNMAVDLNGNVLTCQNVSSVSTNPSGVSHHIGHVSDLENVKLNTATHWSDRTECPNCPVVHICKGACMFLSGPLWEASCNNAFSDNIVVFCNAIEFATGWVPQYIDGPQREDRKDIFWWNGKPENARKTKKIIPIMAA